MKVLPFAVLLPALTFFPAVHGAPPAWVEREARAADAGDPADAIVGEWWTEKKDGRVKFVKYADGSYKGILSWGIHPRKDDLNRDPKLRDRPVIGIVLMWHLVYRDGEYVDGYVYNPEDGGTYRMKAWLTSRDSLKVRGYVGISLFGQTQIWTRYA
jgi:uncharacterized protein (DUF2147 family)